MLSRGGGEAPREMREREGERGGGGVRWGLFGSAFGGRSVGRPVGRGGFLRCLVTTMELLQRRNRGGMGSGWTLLI